MKLATVSIFSQFALLTETIRKTDSVSNGKEGGGVV